jgi:hypothetical protein
MQKLQNTSVRAGRVGHYVDDLVSRNDEYYRRWRLAQADIPNAEIRHDAKHGETSDKSVVIAR